MSSISTLTPYLLVITPMRFFISLLLFLLTGSVSTAQQVKLSGTITDAVTGGTLPFATIKPGHSSNGVLSDLNGNFILQVADSNSFLQISYMGYESLTYPITGKVGNNILIRLVESRGRLQEVIVKPPYEKIRTIVNSAIANRHLHQPANYEWYQCNVYQKTVADFQLQDSLRWDTSNTNALMHFSERNHLLLSETYNRRTYKKRHQLQHEVLATRVSGWKRLPLSHWLPTYSLSMFTATT